MVPLKTEDVKEHVTICPEKNTGLYFSQGLDTLDTYF